MRENPRDMEEEQSIMIQYYNTIYINAIKLLHIHLDITISL